MRVATRRTMGFIGLLLLLLVARPAAAQHGLPPRTQTFDVVAADSVGQTIALHLVGKAMGTKGRQYAGKCTVMASHDHPANAKLTGVWVLTQNSPPAVAAGARPAIGGIGTREGAKPWKPGQNPTAAGQVINFTIDPLPDGRYTVLLMDTFNDDILEFKFQPTGR